MNDANMRSQATGIVELRSQRGRLRPIHLVAMMALPWILAVGSAWAQTTDEPPPGAPVDPLAGIEEMIVVGSDLVESLAPTSTAVTSFDALELEALGVSDISNLAAYTPNLEIRTAGSTNATFFIRGVGLNDFTANAASAVAIYVDEAPRNLPAIQLGLLYDLQNVEIQKGPQGSGPGRNASAGAIRILTKKPTGEYDAYLNMDYGNYNLIDIEGGLEVPIVEDVFGMRSAFRMKTRDGIVTNRCGGLSPAEIAISLVCQGVQPNMEKNLNNTDSWSTRTSLRFLPPVDDMEWILVGHIDRIDQLATVGEHLGTAPNLGGQDKDSYRSPEIDAEAAQIRASLNIPTNQQCRRAPDPAACFASITELSNLAGKKLAKSLARRPLDKLPFEGDYNNSGFERQTSYGTTLTGDWQIGTLVLKSISGFERYDRERLIDADYSPNTTFEFDIVDDAWQVTEDMRLSSELESIPLTWNVGAFYLQEELDYVQQTLAEGGPVEPILQQYVQKSQGVGVFGEFSWDLLDDLTLDAGVRYNWEHKSFAAEIFRGANPRNLCDPIPNANQIPPCQRTETVDHPTGKIAFTYRFDELREIYFKYSHGWKGLQFNPRDGSRAGEVTDVADPEVIDAFELGFKGGWLEDRISVDGALFWYAYQNYQVFTFTNNPQTAPVRVVINANDAINFGAELTTTLRPVEGLTADVRFGWLEARFLDFTDTAARSTPGGGGSNDIYKLKFDYNNNQLPNAPRFKISTGLEYAVDLDRWGRITPRYDLTWTDDVNFDPSGGHGAPDDLGNLFMPDDTIGQQAFMLHNVSIRYTTSSEQLEVAVWARNITNEVYKILAFDASGGPGFVGNLVGDPRMYGVTLRVSY